MAESTMNNIKNFILAVIILGAFVSLLNQTLMNVALPSIMEDLDIVESTAQWITTGFMLVNGVLIPVTAFLMEKFSTRQLFLTAISLFAAGTLICGIAPDFTILMAGRVIQAVGAGIIMPLLTTVVLALFPVEKRGGAMGVIGIAIIFAPAVDYNIIRVCRRALLLEIIILHYFPNCCFNDYSWSNFLEKRYKTDLPEN